MRWACLLLVLSAVVTWGADWKLARPGWQYEFPRDHYSHAGFKTEWWYFTGNLRDDSGRGLGFQLTFFRQGIRPEGRPADVRSRFVVGELSVAHFAVTEIGGGKFHHAQHLARGALGEAGFAIGSRIAWIRNWTLDYVGPGQFHLYAETEEVGLNLQLQAEKAPVFHGANGISRKAEGEGRASHYYSFTRLAATGKLRLPSGTLPVTGYAWYDHEWATNQLTAEQEGWDWFSLQFADNTELMLFQIRLKDGGRDPFSSGTWVDADGATTAIQEGEFSLTPQRYWQSSETPGVYPVRWKLKIPKLDLEAEISTPVEAQELALDPITYWEGAIRAEGTRANQPLRGSGYLEMTGYGSTITGMQAEE